MADTIRTTAALQVLLADNTSQDISPQDIRDFLVSCLNRLDDKVGFVLFDHYVDVGNVGTGEDDLYSDTLTAGRLAADGEKITFEYGGSFVSSATATRQIRLRFANMALIDTGALTTATAEAWSLKGTIIRVSATVVRYRIEFEATTAVGAGLFSEVAVGELTGLTLSGTNILKVTGEAAAVGAATNDIVAKMGTGSWTPAA